MEVVRDISNNSLNSNTPSTSSLNAYVGAIPAEELELFTKIYTQFKEFQLEGPPASKIKRFYEKPPVISEGIQQKLREEARSIFLQRKSQSLLNNDELKLLWSLLEQHHTLPDVDEEKMINYKDFKFVADKIGPKASTSSPANDAESLFMSYSNPMYYVGVSAIHIKRSCIANKITVAAGTESHVHVHCTTLFLSDLIRLFFSPIVFAKLQQQDPYGRISITQFFHYVMRKTWLHQSRIGLSLYDISGQGYLTEKDVELYIMELMPTLPQLEPLEESLRSFYVCTAVRKFMFFLDPLRQGKVRIVDVLASGFLDDLLELREPKDLKEVSEKNWFGINSAMKIYAQYLNLDTDRNGMLSQDELAKYGTGTLTDVFVERIFQECLTYEGEMDYKGYLDFVLAMENKKDPSSLQYFFRVLDVRGKGYLDAFAINFFFRAIQKLLEEQEQPIISFEDIKDEIFDMVKPNDPLKIKLQDLTRSGQGDTVVNILTDLNGFWNYENREVLSAETDNENEEDATEC